jgi:hypothetical protein
MSTQEPDLFEVIFGMPPSTRRFRSTLPNGQTLPKELPSAIGPHSTRCAK